MSSTLLKHKIIPYVFSRIPLLQLCKLTGTNLLIPYYHMISNDEIIHIKHLYPYKSLKQFTDDLNFLLKHFVPIELAELIAFSKNGKWLPPKAFHLTFDDGFREIHDSVALILQKRGIPATIFINSGFTDNQNFCYQHKASVLADHILKKNISVTAGKHIEDLLLQNNIKANSLSAAILTIKYKQRALVDIIANILGIDLDNYLSQNKPYLTTEQINKLINDGFTIGAHSIDHPLYIELSLDEQIRQTTESVKFVKDKFHLGYSAFAFPHSDLGISKKYFSTIKQSGLVDISFGTAGMIDDCVPDNFQRFSLEKPLMPARNIINMQLARRIMRQIKNGNRIIRA